MIKEILGFADFPADARYPTVELLGKGLTPANNPGATSAYVSSALYNQRRWLRVYGTASPRVTMNLKDVGFTLEEIRTRKIYGGFRYVITNNSVADTNGILYLTRATNYSILAKQDLTSMQGEAYIEFMIDVSTLTYKVWIDGVVKRTGALASTETDTAIDTIVQYGQYSGSGTSDIHMYNDFYWILDTADLDDTPSKRLGPVKVGALKVNASELPEDWVVPEGQTPVSIMDTATMGPTGEVSPVIRTSPAETVATFGFEAPVTTFPIRAVSMELYGFRDTGTVPTLQTQLRQGEALGTKKTHAIATSVLLEGAAANRLGCFNKDLNGQPWTIESLDQLEILLNSKTGS